MVDQAKKGWAKGKLPIILSILKNVFIHTTGIRKPSKELMIKSFKQINRDMNRSGEELKRKLGKIISEYSDVLDVEKILSTKYKDDEYYSVEWKRLDAELADLKKKSDELGELRKQGIDTRKLAKEYLGVSESKQEIELKVKSDNRKIHGEKFPYEKVSLFIDGKKMSKCIFFKPFKSEYNNKPCYEIETGESSEKFSDKNGNFIMMYQVESIKKGKGYGTILFKKLTEYLKKNGVDTIYLNVDIDNVNAQRFYKRLGFKKKWEGSFDYRFYLKIK
jgi:hypothetical protein